MTSSTVLILESTLLCSLAALYIMQCPFNKVEESFNTQAIHDIVNILPNHLPHHHLRSKEEIEQREIAIREEMPWDHMQYPGVVPRTSIGALSVGLPLKVLRSFLIDGLVFEFENQEIEDEPDVVSQFLLQLCSRFALSFLLVLSLTTVTRALQKRYGLGFRLCFLFTIASQFHYLFYAGRFLPNTFACILANLVFSTWINRQFSKSLIYIATCVVIFRFDTSLFFGCLLFDAVFVKRILPISRVLTIGIPVGLLAIALTLSVDSLFWARTVWPEFEGLYFNVWLNKSHEWGVQPFFWYIYSCLPRILMFSSPFILLAEHRFTRDYLIPIIAFIMIYSILPHKELRFILFVSPFLNVCVVSGLMNVLYYLNEFFSLGRSNNSNRQGKTSPRQEKPKRSLIASALFVLILVAMVTGNLLYSFVLTRVSTHNYPGGHAAMALGSNHELLAEANKAIEAYNSTSIEPNSIKDLRSNAAVYVNNLAAQTGVSRFVQVNGVYYSKTPKIDSTTFRKAYKLIYLILEPKEIKNFLKSYCPPQYGDNRRLTSIDIEGLKSRTDRISCKLPNQLEQHCSIEENINKFRSINIGSLLNQLRSSRSISQILSSLQDSVFIKTRVALHLIRCTDITPQHIH